MSRSRIRPRQPNVGIAIAMDRMWVCLPAQVRGQPHTELHIELEPPEQGAAVWPALAHALGKLKEDLGGRAPSASVALLPPLAQVRLLESPFLRPEEYRRVLACEASRYFFDARTPQVAAALADSHQRSSPVTVLAAAAPERLVECVLQAAQSSGWRIETVVPAHAAWIAAALDSEPSLGVELGWLIIPDKHSTYWLQLRGGQVHQLRRFPPGTRTVDELSSADARTPLVMVGAGPEREPLVDAFRSRGLQVTVPESLQADSPGAVAAAFSGCTTGPELLPERIHAQRRTHVRGLSASFAAVACLLLGLAAAFESWGLKRELNTVLARRAVIGPSASLEAGRREELVTLVNDLSALSNLQNTVPKWSTIFVEVAARLPDDAYVTAVRARGDSVVLEGLSRRAGSVVEALRQSPQVRALRALSPLRQELRDGRNPVERFSVQLRLARSPGTVP